MAFLTIILSSNVTLPGSNASSILAGSVPNSEGKNLYQRYKENLSCKLINEKPTKPIRMDVSNIYLSRLYHINLK